MKAGWQFDRYGFGAARIALRAQPYPGADRALALGHGLALAFQEWSRDGHSLRTLSLSAGALLLAVWLVGSLVSGALRSRDASPDLEIVMFESPALEEPPVPEPEPILEPEPEPIAAPAPEPEPVAKPEPRPEVVAALPPPAPEPAPIAKPAPKPKPAPAVKPAAPPPVRVAKPSLPAPPPRIAAAPRPAAAPPRPPAPRPALSKPVVAIDAVAAPAAPSEARPAASPPPRLALRPAATRPAPARPAPSFDLGAPAAPSPMADEATAPSVSARASSPAASPARASARSVARPPASLALPALSAGRAVRDPGAEPTPSRVGAPAHAPSSDRSSPPRAAEPRLAGVPLGSLASCVSDREEDALKQQLVALLGRPTECVSPAGRYRFVETRNLNSFLLWVERAPSRREADRCVELTFALECIRRRAGGEWSRG
jgi:hypothetical protein